MVEKTLTRVQVCKVRLDIGRFVKADGLIEMDLRLAPAPQLHRIVADLIASVGGRAMVATALKYVEALAAQVERLGVTASLAVHHSHIQQRITLVEQVV